MNKNIKILLLLLIVFLYYSNLYSQPVTEWIQRYNSPGNQNEDLIDMVQDKYGNTFITGNVGSPTDIITLKYSSSWNLLWSRTYNGPANRGDEAVKINVDDSGFVYVVGDSFNYIEFNNYLTIKYSSAGDIIWIRELENNDSTGDVPRDMVLDDSANIYITGSGNSCAICPSDYITIKYDRNGDLLWKKLYHGEGYFSNIGWSLSVDKLNRVIVSGRSRDKYNSDITATVIYDSNGNQLNVIKYDSSYVNNVRTDLDNNTYLGGYRRKNVFQNHDDIFVNKYDINGNLEWSRIYDSPNSFMNHNEYLRDMRIDKQSQNIYVTGYGDFNGQAGWEYLLLKYGTRDGDSVWQKNYSPIDHSSSGAEYITIDKYNNIYITGSSDYNTPYNRFLTVKYDSAGNFIWAENYLNILFFNHYAKRILVDSTNSVYVGGTSYGPESGSNDIVLIKYSQITNVPNSLNEIPWEIKLYQNYPNPFNPVTNIEYQLPMSGEIKVSIFDLLGRIVATLVNERQNQGSYNIQWDASDFSSGMYFYNLEINGNIFDTKKLILIK